MVPHPDPVRQDPLTNQSIPQEYSPNLQEESLYDIMTTKPRAKTKTVDIHSLLRQASLSLAKARKLLKQKSRNGKNKNVREK
jgi:hypothetical protein